MRHIAGREASCVLQCPTRPSPRCNCVEDTRWPCSVQSGLQRRTHTMLMATIRGIPSGAWYTSNSPYIALIRFRRTSECRARSSPTCLFDGD